MLLHNTQINPGPTSTAHAFSLCIKALHVGLQIGVSCYTDGWIRLKLDIYLVLLNKEYMWYYSYQSIVCWCMLLW